VSNTVLKGKSGLSLDALGERIQVRIAKGNDSHISAGCDLVEAKDMIRMQDPKDRQYTWQEYLAKYCEVGKGRANKLIALR
jgi:hypothetical protein